VHVKVISGAPSSPRVCGQLILVEGSYGFAYGSFHSLNSAIDLFTFHFIRTRAARLLRDFHRALAVSRGTSAYEMVCPGPAASAAAISVGHRTEPPVRSRTLRISSGDVVYTVLFVSNDENRYASRDRPIDDGVRTGLFRGVSTWLAPSLRCDTGPGDNLYLRHTRRWSLSSIGARYRSRALGALLFSINRTPCLQCQVQRELSCVISLYGDLLCRAISIASGTCWQTCIV